VAADRTHVYIPRERWSPALAALLDTPDPALGDREADRNVLFAVDALAGTRRETVPASLLDAARANAVPLWPDGAPGAAGEGWRHEPTLYPVVTKTGREARPAVVVIPGGAYRFHAPWEGFPIAEWFALRGIAAFVVQYRLLPYVMPAALDDVQRAIRTVRANASAWGVDAARVAVIGFSAGGHLSALASSLYDEPDPLMADDVAAQSARPDAAILFYPAISLRLRHKLPIECLGVAEPGEDWMARYSAQMQVHENTSPAFLIGSVTDQETVPGHLLGYAQALAAHGVGHELHLYGSGVHGSGIYDPRPTHMTWEVLLQGWLRERGFLR